MASRLAPLPLPIRLSRKRRREYHHDRKDADPRPSGSNGVSPNGILPDIMPSLPPIEVSNRRSQAWRVLRDSIVSGRLPAGTKLIGSQLAEQLGVSRTPLREAMQLLEREGFVRGCPAAWWRSWA